MKRLLTSLVSLALVASPAAADPAVWRVEGPHAVVYLLGSTPSVSADGRWRTREIQDVAAQAQEIWLLAPMGLPGPVTALRMLATIQTQGRLPGDARLSALLSPDGRARLQRLAQRYGISMDKLDRMTPWYAQITLSLAARKADGSSKGLPLERFVIGLAPRADRRAFDNLETDLKLLISLPQKEQVFDLEEAMKRYEDPALNARYAEAWEQADMGWILKEREDRLKDSAPVTWETLQVKPRQRWADQIAALAAGSKTAVVILDAANLVGPQGLPAMLRRKGLEVKGP